MGSMILILKWYSAIAFSNAESATNEMINKLSDIWSILILFWMSTIMFMFIKLPNIALDTYALVSGTVKAYSVHPVSILKSVSS